MSLSDHAAAARSSLSGPRATIFNASSGSGTMPLPHPTARVSRCRAILRR